jgi:hypothetical protein
MRSTVLSLPLQLVFPAQIYLYFSYFGQVECCHCQPLLTSLIFTNGVLFPLSEPFSQMLESDKSGWQSCTPYQQQFWIFISIVYSKHAQISSFIKYIFLFNLKFSRLDRKVHKNVLFRILVVQCYKSLA